MYYYSCVVQGKQEAKKIKEKRVVSCFAIIGFVIERF